MNSAPTGHKRSRKSRMPGVMGSDHGAPCVPTPDGDSGPPPARQGGRRVCLTTLMCGIAGLVDPRGAPEGELSRLASGMASTLEHRGPDDSGVWEDTPAGVALAHRRLEVVGRGAQGRQPMRAGPWVLNYNGELYNTAELARRCGRRRRQRGTSDTEALASTSPRGAWSRRCAVSKGCSPSPPGTVARAAAPGARPFRREAPVLRLGRRLRLRLRAQGVSRAGRLPAFRRSASVAPLQLSCVPAPHASTRVRQAAPGLAGDSHGCRRARGDARSSGRTGPPMPAIAGAGRLPPL